MQVAPHIGRRYPDAMMHPKPVRANGPSREDAEALAIKALGFVASDAELLPRFLSLTGIEAQDVRRAANEPGFLAGVLQFVVAHEPTLTRFAGECGIEASSVLSALRALPFGDDRHLGSA